MILKASKDKYSDSIPREQPKDLQIISQPPSSYTKKLGDQQEQQPSPVISSSLFLPSVPSRSVQAISVTVRRNGGPFSYLDDDSINHGNKEDVLNAKTDESSTLIQHGEGVEEASRVRAISKGSQMRVNYINNYVDQDEAIKKDELTREAFRSDGSSPSYI